MPNKFVYHGTSQEKWAEKVKHPSSIYLSHNIDIAQKHAKKWVDHGFSPVIVRLALHDLMTSKIEMHQDWENVERAARGIWMGRQKERYNGELIDSGTFCLFGDIEKIKPLVMVIPFNTDRQTPQAAGQVHQFEQGKPLVRPIRNRG